MAAFATTNGAMAPASHHDALQPGRALARLSRARKRIGCCGSRGAVVQHALSKGEEHIRVEGTLVSFVKHKGCLLYTSPSPRD